MAVALTHLLWFQEKVAGSPEAGRQDGDRGEEWWFPLAGGREAWTMCLKIRDSPVLCFVP